MLLAEEGAQVVVCDIGASLQGEGSDAGPAQETVRRHQKSRRRRDCVNALITDPKTPRLSSNPRSMLSAALTILVNNAGILRDVISTK